MATDVTIVEENIKLTAAFQNADYSEVNAGGLKNYIANLQNKPTAAP